VWRKGHRYSPSPVHATAAVTGTKGEEDQCHGLKMMGYKAAERKQSRRKGNTLLF
jgi:hypothetical protein